MLASTVKLASTVYETGIRRGAQTLPTLSAPQLQRARSLIKLNARSYFNFEPFINNNNKICQQTSHHPYITYCSSTWSSTYVTKLNRVDRSEKRAVQASFGHQTFPVWTGLYQFRLLSTFSYFSLQIRNLDIFSNQHVSNSSIYVLSEQHIASIVFQLVSCKQ